jgi:NAD(P) transhydrogenase subunit alpha
MIISIPKETIPGERRVALVPELVPRLAQSGMDVLVQHEAGTEAGFPDSAYLEKGAHLEPEVFSTADVLLKVQPPTLQEAARLKEGTIIIGLLQPYSHPSEIQTMAERGLTSFAMEFMPRISRAQPMDALSAMSTVAGYKAVLLAASHLPKFFPLLMTAAGTVTPARVLIVGAGVAGLQAIGTAKRLGAVVEAYDTRPVVKEQVESLGAKFVELALETSGSERKDGYAAAQSEAFYQNQQQLMTQCIESADVVITTALVPGQRAPVLITEAMVQRMRPGSVVVDLASEQGGNCALTEPGREVTKHGVLIIGAMNLPATVPYHASQMYAKTVTSFLTHLLQDGSIHLDLNDELTRGPLVTYQGKILHDGVKALLLAAGRAPT